MVCEKTKDSKHDFTKDPIKLVYEGDWLKADNTTLGADNGIAIAMGLVAALDKSIPHPPLELLFTVDEETGLVGANELKSGFIKGKILLNLDSEDEGVFTVGCAGGKHTFVTLPLEYSNVPGNYLAFKLVAGGMKGGHSGVDIKEERANAIKILTRALAQLKGKIRLVNVTGGTAHNAIPRDAEAVLFVPENSEKSLKKIIKDFEKSVKAEFVNTEPNLMLKIEKFTPADNRAMTSEITDKVINLLYALPHGVTAMSTDIEGLVETSNNLANVKIEKGNFKILASQRSSVMSRLTDICNQIESAAFLAGADAETSKGYPAWEPNMDSPLLDKCKKLYKKMYKKDPVIEVIHAGLECGIIGSKYPGMDMISFGPTIKNPHSPDECINIETIGMVWDYLLELFKILK